METKLSEITFFEEIQGVINSLQKEKDKLEPAINESITIFINGYNPGILQEATQTIEQLSSNMLSTLQSNVPLTEKYKSLRNFVAESYAEVFFTKGSIPYGPASIFLSTYLQENANSISDDSSLVLLARTINKELVAKHKYLETAIESKLDKNFIKVDKANEEIGKYANDLEKAKKDLDAYIESAENVKSQLSFQVLSNAFNVFYTNKNNEKRIYAALLYTIGILLVILPVCFSFVNYRYNNKTININSLFYAIPTVTIEILLLFYFRVVLKIFSSIKAQILQLSLRISLLNFIKNYVKFKDIEKIGNLDKFESLIFSNLVSDSDKIPSTVDGLDQLAKVLAQAKKFSSE